MIHAENCMNYLFFNWADEHFHCQESLLACLGETGLEVALISRAGSCLVYWFVGAEMTPK